MEENKNKLFREKSLEKVSSPEKLDAYLQVTSVGVWAILSAIIVLLIGAIIWGTFGKIESSISIGCVVSNSQAYCFTNEENASKVKEDMTIVINEEESTVQSIAVYGPYTAESSDVGINMSGASEGEFVYIINGNINLQDGMYKGKIITERISPLKFVFN